MMTQHKMKLSLALLLTLGVSMTVNADPQTRKRQPQSQPVVSKCVIATRCERVSHEHGGTGDPDAYKKLSSTADGVKFTGIMRENGKRVIYTQEFNSYYSCMECSEKDYIKAWARELPGLERQCREAETEVTDNFDTCSSQVGALDKPGKPAMVQDAEVKIPDGLPPVGSKVDKAPAGQGQ